MTAAAPDRSNEVNEIIARVRSAVPDAIVTQMHKTHPADDDGLWWFHLPDVAENIQIESSTYHCPFFIVHSGMQSSSEAVLGQNVQQVADEVTRYLRSLR